MCLGREEDMCESVKHDSREEMIKCFKRKKGGGKEQCSSGWKGAVCMFKGR